MQQLIGPCEQFFPGAFDRQSRKVSKQGPIEEFSIFCIIRKRQFKNIRHLHIENVFLELI